jgi:DNA-binding transcriptional LysR family regulator
MDREDWAALASFTVVAEERSFTRAAARLGVTASALSHTMRRLEERLGVQLLARSTRSVSTTEAGEKLRLRLNPQSARSHKRSKNSARARGGPRVTFASARRVKPRVA